MSLENKFIPFALIDTDEAELNEIREALDSGWLTTGPKTRQFESQFAAMVGARYAIAVNSCTAAMHLALESIGLQRGDEVISSPYTFAATAEVIRYFDAHPVFVDIDPVTCNIDPSKIEKAITPKTRALLPVHVAGYPAELDRILEIAQKHRLNVIEDAAHAFPTSYKGKMIGSISDATCFSFYATKTITTGEGGMICTDEEAIANRCRIMSLHGLTHDAWKRYKDESTWYYEITAPGFKYNMTDIAAAMGLAQLKKADAMLKKRTEIAEAYHTAFFQLPQLQIPHDDPVHQHAWHLYMLRLNLETLRIDRAKFIDEMKARNIGTSVHFIPLHIHPYYRDLYRYNPDHYPVAYHEYMREISLPIYSKMSSTDVRTVIDTVVDIIHQFKR